MAITFKLYHPQKTVDRIVGNDKVGVFVAETWGKIFKNYVPMDSGTLRTTYDSNIPFKVTYTEHYSFYQWNGISKSGRPLHYSKEKNPNAQSHWENQAYKDRGKEVAQATENYIRRM